MVPTFFCDFKKKSMHATKHSSFSTSDSFLQAQKKNASPSFKKFNHLTPAPTCKTRSTPLAVHKLWKDLMCDHRLRQFITGDSPIQIERISESVNHWSEKPMRKGVPFCVSKKNSTAFVKNRRGKDAELGFCLDFICKMICLRCWNPHIFVFVCWPKHPSTSQKHSWGWLFVGSPWFLFTPICGIQEFFLELRLSLTNSFTNISKTSTSLSPTKICCWALDLCSFLPKQWPSVRESPLGNKRHLSPLLFWNCQYGQEYNKWRETPRYLTSRMKLSQEETYPAI